MFSTGILAAIGAAFLAVVYGIKRAFDARATNAKQAADDARDQAAAAKVNTDARASAEVSRDTETKLNKEVSDVETKTEADRAAVASGSLRDGSNAVQDAINRANGGM